MCFWGERGYSTALGCGAGNTNRTKLWHREHCTKLWQQKHSCRVPMFFVCVAVLLVQRRVEPGRTSPGPVTSPLAPWVGLHRAKPLAASRAQAASGAQKQQSLKGLRLTASLGQKHTLGLKMWTRVAPFGPTGSSQPSSQGWAAVAAGCHHPKQQQVPAAAPAEVLAAVPAAVPAGTAAAHQVRPGPPSRPGAATCRLFQIRGFCPQGERCPFDHPSSNPSEQAVLLSSCGIALLAQH